MDTTFQKDFYERLQVDYELHKENSVIYKFKCENFNSNSCTAKLKSYNEKWTASANDTFFLDKLLGLFIKRHTVFKNYQPHNTSLISNDPFYKLLSASLNNKKRHDLVYENYGKHLYKYIKNNKDALVDMDSLKTEEALTAIYSSMLFTAIKASVNDFFEYHLDGNNESSKDSMLLLLELYCNETNHSLELFEKSTQPSICHDLDLSKEKREHLEQEVPTFTSEFMIPLMIDPLSGVTLALYSHKDFTHRDLSVVEDIKQSLSERTKKVSNPNTVTTNNCDNLKNFCYVVTQFIFDFKIKQVNIDEQSENPFFSYTVHSTYKEALNAYESNCSDCYEQYFSHIKPKKEQTLFDFPFYKSYYELMEWQTESSLPNYSKHSRD